MIKLLRSALEWFYAKEEVRTTQILGFMWMGMMLEEVSNQTHTVASLLITVVVAMVLITLFVKLLDFFLKHSINALGGNADEGDQDSKPGG